MKALFISDWAQVTYLVIGSLRCMAIYQINEVFHVYSMFDHGINIGTYPSMIEAKQASKLYVDKQLDSLEWEDDAISNKVKEHNNQCEELTSLIKAEVKVIKKHLNRHMWFKHIDKENDAVNDFIKQYGWILKEIYCTTACPKHIDCKHAQELRNGGIEE